MNTTPSKRQQYRWLTEGQLASTKDALNKAEACAEAKAPNDVTHHILTALTELHRAVANMDRRLRELEDSHAE